MIFFKFKNTAIKEKFLQQQRIFYRNSDKFKKKSNIIMYLDYYTNAKICLICKFIIGW